MMMSCVLPVAATSQEARYKWDIGVGAGMSGYVGDANTGFPFRHPGAAVDIFCRYNIDSRWGVRTQAGLATLSGNTADMDNVLPDFKEYSFKSTAFDLGGRVEFNFFAYGIGETYKKLRRWSPYLTVGVGLTLATCSGQSNVGLNIPMGAGIKYKIKERLNLGLEFTMTKVFSDHVDGALADLYQIKSSFLKNTDWYSNISLSLTYEFGKRCSTCHYVD